MQASPDRFQPIDIIFDSSQSTNGDLDNPLFKLTPELDNIVGASVQWISCPFTYYVIDRTNNYFDFILQQNKYDGSVGQGSATDYGTWIRYDLENGTISDGLYVRDAASNGGFSQAVKQRVYLQPGTYTPESLTGAVRYAMDTQVGSQNFYKIDTVDEYQGWSVKLDPSTSRVTIYNNLLPTYQNSSAWHSKPYADRVRYSFAFRFNKSLAEILGFPEDQWLISRDRTIYEGKTKVTIQNAWQNDDLDNPNIPSIISESCANFLQNQRLNVHSNLAFLFNNNRLPIDTSDIIKTIPIDTNYSSYIVHASSAEPFQITRTNVNQVSFYLTVGDRRIYSRSGHESGNSIDTDSTRFFVVSEPNGTVTSTTTTFDGTAGTLPFETQSYLHLNGEPFMICVRFYRDDGFMAQ